MTNIEKFEEVFGFIPESGDIMKYCANKCRKGIPCKFKDDLSLSDRICHSLEFWDAPYRERQTEDEDSDQEGWILVSERLPEEREWYLVVFKEKDTGFQLIPRVADYIGNGENKWRIIDEEGLSQEYRDILECIAWMPLQKPYESQESEG